MRIRSINSIMVRRVWMGMWLAAAVLVRSSSTGSRAQEDPACWQIDQSFVGVVTSHSVAVADLNEDGHLDLAVVAHFPINPDEAGAIFLGDGTGAFHWLTYFPVGDHNHGVVLVDINHDGHLDLVTSTAGIQDPEAPVDVAHTFLGDGTGHFSQHHMWRIRLSRLGPLDVQVADLNHDTHLDLIAAGAGLGNMAVLLGDGTGQFERAKYYLNIPTRTRSSVVADFNSDGNLDVVASNRYSNSVSLFVGNGEGQVRLTDTFTTGLGPRSITAADFNGDGRLDLAVTCREPGVVSVLLGEGPGTFAKAQNFPVAIDPRTLVARDFDGDGFLDLAVTNAKAQSVSVLHGDGQGNFGRRTDVQIGDGPIGGIDPPGEGEGSGLVGLDAADVNEDGKPDLLVTSTYDDHIYVLLNRCP